LAAWMTLVFYNMSEAAFEGGLLWMMLLLGAITLPERAKNRAQSVVTFDDAGAAFGDVFATDQPILTLEMTSQRR